MPTSTFCYNWFFSSILLFFEAPTILFYFSCFLPPYRLSFSQELAWFWSYPETISYFILIFLISLTGCVLISFYTSKSTFPSSFQHIITQFFSLLLKVFLLLSFLLFASLFFLLFKLSKQLQMMEMKKRFSQFSLGLKEHTSLFLPTCVRGL